MLVTILSLNFLFAFIYVTAYIDYEHLRDNDFIEDHTTRFIQRFLFIITLALAQTNFLLAFIGFSLIFAATFDNTLNKLRKKPTFYLGTTAKWDKFWTKYPIAYKIFIVIGFLLGITLLLL